MLFNNLTLEDWRKIRGKSFGEVYDKFEDSYDKNYFTLEVVCDYMNQSNNTMYSNGRSTKSFVNNYEKTLDLYKK